MNNETNFWLKCEWNDVDKGSMQSFMPIWLLDLLDSFQLRNVLAQLSNWMNLQQQIPTNQIIGIET